MLKFSIPTYFRDLEKFGVGVFSASEIEQKCAEIRALMSRRTAPKSPLVSVIIPAHREEKYILATLKSLALQTFPQVEFLIVSNGETEQNETKKIAEKCGFRVIYEQNPGITRARQIGLEAAQGEIIITTDADTLHPQDWIERIVHIFREKNIVCGNGVVHVLSRKILPKIAQEIMLNFFFWVKHSIHPSWVTGVPEGNSFYLRDAALAVGGYDLDIRLSEGIALFRKFRPKNQGFVFFDEHIAAYTSGRRYEQSNLFRLWVIGMWNAIRMAFGSKSRVTVKDYPDIR